MNNVLKPRATDFIEAVPFPLFFIFLSILRPLQKLIKELRWHLPFNCLVVRWPYQPYDTCILIFAGGRSHFSRTNLPTSFTRLPGWVKLAGLVTFFPTSCLDKFLSIERLLLTWYWILLLFFLRDSVASFVSPISFLSLLPPDSLSILDISFMQKKRERKDKARKDERIASLVSENRPEANTLLGRSARHLFGKLFPSA